MNTSFTFTSSARSTGGKKGVAEGHGIQPSIPFSAPPEFQGEAGIWTPEHFFTSAVAACFISTFQAIAAYSKFEAQAVAVSVEGLVEKGEGGFRFTRVAIRPILTVHSEADRERGLRLLEKAEKACLVTRSLQSEIILESQVLVSAAPATV